MPKRNQHRPYPWDRWFQKKQYGLFRFKLVRGKHFDCMPQSMSVQIRNAAEKRGIRVGVSIRESLGMVVLAVERKGKV